VGNNPLKWVDPWGLKPGDPFLTVDAAAVDALNWVYTQYPAGQNEWAGTVYQRDDDKKFVATNPLEGGPDWSEPSHPTFPIKPVARYHTHGQCTPDHVEDDFLDGFFEDKWKADFWGTSSYLGTPGGYRKRYDPDPNLKGNGAVTILREGCSCPGPTR